MELIAGWQTPLALLRSEQVQREWEGCEIPDELRDAVAALDDDDDAFAPALPGLAQRLAELPRRTPWPYNEPDDLPGIRRDRPEGPRRLPLGLSDAQLLDRLHGAWTGRACGCALGKPVEGLGMRGSPGLNGRLAIKRYLTLRGHWPLNDYFSGVPADDGVTLGCYHSWREHIAFMEPDDDIHYTLIGLKVLEQFGPGFQWYDVADTWNSSLPYNAICTAETQAILNYNLKTPRGRRDHFRPSPGWTSRHNNPYREWIGAQIRADGWAYACAGNPELAAEFAWRDAHWTHRANGIYGEMFMAAVIAAAFVEQDPNRLVDIGLSEIPRDCRLAIAVSEARKWLAECPDFEAFMQRLETRYDGMSPVHTVNNALIVIMALFYGEMDPDRTVSTAVMGALDTDCNGATAGSVTGAARGREDFGGTLAASLNDTIRPLVFGFQDVTMRELAERTLTVHGTVSREVGN